MRRIKKTRLDSLSYVRVPVLFALISGVYIVLSSMLFGEALGYSNDILFVEIVKGLAFVLVTAGVLWFVLYREQRRSLLGQTSFQALVENMPDAVFLLDLPARKILYANAAAERLFRYDRRELVGQGTELLHVSPERHAEFDALSAGVLEADGRFATDFELRRKNGDVFPTSHVVSVFEDHRGSRFALSIVRDESEKRAYENRLRDSEERLRLIAENLREVLWISDPDKGEMYYASPAYEKVWGRSVAELYQNPRSFLNSIHAEDRDWVEQQLSRQRDGDYDVQYRLLAADGTIRWIWDRAVPIRAPDGSVDRVVGIAEDITELKQRETELRQAQKMEAIGQLSGGIAHDFNNLLTIILGNAEALEESLPDGTDRKEEMQAIISASRSAASLTQRLLTFSRQQRLSRELVDLNALIGELVERLLRRTLGAHISIETVLAEDAWPVATDPSQLETCLVNLAINARDAMPEGGRLTLATRNVPLNEHSANLRHGAIAPGDYVELAVSDTGTGMTSEVAAKAFEPFFTTKAPGKGTGLGLSTVYGFVQQSGGHIAIASVEGQGTRFDILLPRHSGEREHAVRAHERDAVPRGSELLLVVEDDPAVREVVTSQLRMLGYGVREAASGRDALERLEMLDGVDLLLTDIVMPGGVNGPQLARSATERQPGLKVLFMSGYSESSALEDAGWSAATKILRKPYTRLELARAVRTALDHG